MTGGRARLDVAVVSRNTDSFLHALLASLAVRLPPEAPGEVHVLDNGSTDRSRELLARWATRVPWLRIHLSPTNLGHGPALDRLLRRHARGAWALLLDSDAVVLSDPVPALEPLLEGTRATTEPTEPFAFPGAGTPPAFVGQVHPEPDQLYAYLCHLVVHRPTYLTLPPFEDAGAPGLAFFRSVEERGLPWTRFRWSDHVLHFGQASLRSVLERGEASHPFFRFARDESRRYPKGPQRLEAERRLDRARDAFLAGTDGPGGALRALEGLELAPAAPPAPRESKRPPRLLPLPWRGAHARRAGAAAGRDALLALARAVRRSAPARVLEIGSGRGATLGLWAQLAREDALLVSVDLPPWELDDPGEPARRLLLQRLARGRQRVEVVRGNPLADETRSCVRELLSGAPVDLLYIAAGAGGGRAGRGLEPAEPARLLEAYRPFVRPGGLLAMTGAPPIAG